MAAVASTTGVVALLVGHAPPGGLVLDLGCGGAEPAEAVAAAGFPYVGCDVEQTAVGSVRARGFEGHLVDPGDGAGLAGRLSEVAGDRPVSAVLVRHALGSVADLEGFVGELRKAVTELGEPLLLVSVANAGRFGLVAGLVTGAVDLPPPGRPAAPSRPFTGSGLTVLLGDAGWEEAARADLVAGGEVVLPPDHPAQVAGTPLGDLLRRLRGATGDDLDVARFVRLFRAAPSHAVPPPGKQARYGDRPFLSVLVRTQGRRPRNLEEALLCLAAQTEQDVEVVVLVHCDHPQPVERSADLVAGFAPGFADRVRVVHVEGGRRGRPLNEGLRLARGRYVAFLDDDDLVTADWAEGFRTGAAAAPGRVVRSVSVDRRVRRAGDADGSAPYVTLGGFETTFAARFDALEHLSRNRTPICSFAVPMDLVRALGASFDEDAVVLEDWRFFLRLALLGGVHDTGLVTSVYHRWEGSESTASTVDQATWEAAHRAVVGDFDAGPLLLPAGSAWPVAVMFEKSRILDHEMPAHNVERADLAARLEAAEAAAAEHRRAQAEALAALEQARAEARRSAEALADVVSQRDAARSRADAGWAEVAAIRASTTWRYTEGIRRLSGLARRASRALAAAARAR